jgi:hypothetical protein
LAPKSNSSVRRESLFSLGQLRHVSRDPRNDSARPAPLAAGVLGFKRISILSDSSLSPNQYWVRDDTDSLGSALAALQKRRYRGT